MLSLLQYISFYFNINFAAFVGFQIAVYAYVVLRILHTQLTSPSSPSLKCLAGVLLYLFYKLCHILIINSILYKAICMPHCYFFSLFDKKLNWTELSELPGKTELRSLTYEHRTKFYLNAECLPGLLCTFIRSRNYWDVFAEVRQPSIQSKCRMFNPIQVNYPPSLTINRVRFQLFDIHSIIWSSELKSAKERQVVLKDASQTWSCEQRWKESRQERWSWSRW